MAVLIAGVAALGDYPCAAINQLLASDILQDLKTGLDEIVAEFGLE